MIAADGASDFLYKHKIIPDYIIGDLDSISPSAKKYFTNKNVTIKKVYDQYKNDLEKCILFALSKGQKKINITGLSGKRLDHTINNLSLLKKYCRKADIKCYDDDFEYYFIKKKTDFIYKIGKLVSLIALPKAGGITTKGLKYPLKNGKLEFGGFQGALNSAIKNVIRIEVKEGHLLVIKKYLSKN
jgi:thiamine pyrophosphokinase